jgi:hypothetical protein
MNETLQTICWVTLAVLACLELYRVYYRIHMLEQTVDKCVDVIERIVRGADTK